MSQFLSGTDENKETTPKVRGKKSIQYKENVVIDLILLRVPLRVAEVAVIDLRFLMTQGFYDGLNSRECAKNMLDQITKRYQTDGKWHY